MAIIIHGKKLCKKVINYCTQYIKNLQLEPDKHCWDHVKFGLQAHQKTGTRQ